MDWTERINSAIAYVEANLQGEIDPQKLARLASCSIYNFERVFAYIAEKTLSQYIRERRLTLAAFDVVRSEERLIDIAIRYGYESQDAFARAYRSYHGVLPSTSRQSPVRLKSCPRIAFHPNIKEDETMQYKIESRPAFTIAGYRERMLTEEAFDRAPQIWRSVYTDGRIQKLHALLMQNGYRPEGILGVAVGGQWGENESVDYYLAVTTSVGSPQTSKADIPADMLELSLPAATWAIIEANGDPFEVIQPVYKWFYTQWLPASGYVLDDLPVIESYRQDNRHTLWFAVKKP